MEVLPEIIRFCVLELNEQRTADGEYVTSLIPEGLGSTPKVEFFFILKKKPSSQFLPHRREGIEPAFPALGDFNFQAQTN